MWNLIEFGRRIDHWGTLASTLVPTMTAVNLKQLFLRGSRLETKYSRMYQVKFIEGSL